MIRQYPDLHAWQRAATARGYVIDNGPRHEYPTRQDFFATPAAYQVVEEDVGPSGWCEAGVFDYEEGAGLLADTGSEWLEYINTADTTSVPAADIGCCSVCGGRDCPLNTPLPF